MIGMLQMFCGKTLKDWLKSDVILKMIDVEQLKEFLRSLKLKWFEHVERMSKEKAPAMAMKLMLKDKKRGRSKK